MIWELIERTVNDDDWSVTERMKIGESYLVRAVWRHRLGGERVDGSALVLTGAFDLPAAPLAIEGPKGGAGDIVEVRPGETLHDAAARALNAS